MEHAETLAPVWDKDDISKTTGEDYRKKQSGRKLQWIETKEFGLVLLHRRPEGEHTLCGIVYDRKTNEPVKKEDFG